MQGAVLQGEGQGAVPEAMGVRVGVGGLPHKSCCYGSISPESVAQQEGGQ